ncbi:type IV pilus secretin PilQ [Thermodesulfatator atlanticus]|uniref:type IV pilus secretin PilQ n=1 Tax=Thermodesulfatator atlanticus TaxID=501497 RepID=UPI0003B65086|nr:type IV pilus secretin PilQ [Thermodesulfatator atlanticus]
MHRIINTLILICFFGLYTSHAEAYDYKIKNINFKEKEDTISIFILFDGLSLKPEVKRTGKKLVLSFKDTKINTINPKLPEGIKKFDIELEDNNTKLFIETKYTLKDIKQKENKIIITLIKEKENSFPYDLPPQIGEIKTPFQDKKYTGEKISLDLQDADIRTVFRMLSEIGNVNIVLGDQISGKITLKLKDVPWDQVLDIVMARFGLGKAEINGIIYIAPLQKLQKQTEEIRKLKEAMIQEKEITPLKREYLTLNYVKACDLIDSGTIKSLMTERGTISCDDRANLLIIKDTSIAINAIKNLIKRIDIPNKQVLIEARIVEISSNFARNLGIQWYGGYYNSGNFRIGPSSAFPVGSGGNPVDGVYDTSTGQNTETPRDSFSKGSLPFGPIVDLGIPEATTTLGLAIGHITSTSALLLDMRLSALETQGLGKIVSAPKIITKDNEEALIRQGYQIPYPQITAEGTVATEFANADLTLKVIPHILPNNEIKLSIDINKSEPDWSRQVNGVPSIITRSAKTFVRVPNGGTVVIGGLKVTKKNESYGRVPGLSKIPGAGNLFKNSQKSQEEQELLIFITAKVVSSAVEEIDY